MNWDRIFEQFIGWLCPSLTSPSSIASSNGKRLPVSSRLSLADILNVWRPLAVRFDRWSVQQKTLAENCWGVSTGRCSFRDRPSNCMCDWSFGQWKNEHQYYLCCHWLMGLPVAKFRKSTDGVWILFLTLDATAGYLNVVSLYTLQTSHHYKRVGSIKVKNFRS